MVENPNKAPEPFPGCHLFVEIDYDLREASIRRQRTADPKRVDGTTEFWMTFDGKCTVWYHYGADGNAAAVIE